MPRRNGASRSSAGRHSTLSVRVNRIPAAMEAAGHRLGDELPRGRQVVVPHAAMEPASRGPGDHGVLLGPEGPGEAAMEAAGHQLADRQTPASETNQGVAAMEPVIGWATTRPPASRKWWYALQWSQSVIGWATGHGFQHPDGRRHAAMEPAGHRLGDSYGQYAHQSDQSRRNGATRSSAGRPAVLHDHRDR